MTRGESYNRRVAREVIAECLIQAQAAGLDGKATLALVDARRPYWMQRGHWPYKVWLKVRGEMLLGRRGPCAPGERRRAPDLAGQAKLF